MVSFSTNQNNQNFQYPIDIRSQFPLTDQKEGKKEEGLRGEWVGVSIGFPFGGLGEPYMYHDLGEFTRIWWVGIEDIFGKISEEFES